MIFLSKASLSRKLALLVMLAVIPSLLILLFSGIEQRQKSIKTAKKKVFQLTNTMAKIQQEIAHSSRNILSTLSLLPEIQTMNTQACRETFRAVLEQNPNFSNITLTRLNGDVLATGKTSTRKNLSDRKHFIEARERKKFAAGEYIVSRVGTNDPTFAFAYPVLDKKGRLKGILTMAIKLSSFSHFHEATQLPEGSFISITDHLGIRLFYYPGQKSTNPVGKPIKTRSWKKAKTAKDPGIFTSTGSDGKKRIFAFEQIRLTPEASPYLYVWAGIPEAYILADTNADLSRNLLMMIIVTAISLYISWVIGKKTEALILNLEKASKEINTLRGILPICSFCKKIRNDEGYYEQIEWYIHKHSGADFSHTVCPACIEEHYPEE